MRLDRSRLAQQRQAMGYTQEELAAALRVDRSTVHRWESGKADPLPYMRPRLATLLGLSHEQLASLLDAAKSQVVPTKPAVRLHRAPRSSSPLADLRRAVVGCDPPTTTPTDLVTLGQDIKAAHELYQNADYDEAGRVLPVLISRLDTPAGGHGAATRRAGGYLAAAKLATKLGDGDLAWVTADRALQAALESEHAALVGVARYQVACALLRNGHTGDAQELAAEAADDLADVSTTEDIAITTSARGALTLLSAVIAARQGDSAKARERLSHAQALADLLGHDGNYLWTGFGPTNVTIHELSVAVGLGDAVRAHALCETIDTGRLPAGLVGRRSQVHLDLGRAAADTQDDSLAVLHLLEAERVAPQAVSRNVNARGVVRTLLDREQRNATPGLRALARRAGVDG